MVYPAESFCYLKQPTPYTSGFLSEEDENINSKGYIHNTISCTLIYSSKDLETF